MVTTRIILLLASTFVWTSSVLLHSLHLYLHIDERCSGNLPVQLQIRDEVLYGCYYRSKNFWSHSRHNFKFWQQVAAVARSFELWQLITTVFSSLLAVFVDCLLFWKGLYFRSFGNRTWDLISFSKIIPGTWFPFTEKCFSKKCHTCFVPLIAALDCSYPVLALGRIPFSSNLKYRRLDS